MPTDSMNLSMSAESVLVVFRDAITSGDSVIALKPESAKKSLIDPVVLLSVIGGECLRGVCGPTAICLDSICVCTWTWVLGEDVGSQAGLVTHFSAPASGVLFRGDTGVFFRSDSALGDWPSGG